MDIATDKLREKIASGEDFLLLDVRERDELAHGRLPGARNIPLSELGAAMLMDASGFKRRYGFEKLRKAQLIIVYCRTGHRSSDATSYLASLGFNAVNYKGGVQEWSKHDPAVRMY